MTDTTTNGPATAEAILRELAQDLGKKIGETYASVKIEAYAGGILTWSCYTAKTQRLSSGTSFADALAQQLVLADPASNAAKFRAEAAALLAKADALEAVK